MADVENKATADSQLGQRLRHRALSSESAEGLIRSVDVFLFDCDGVIWKGDKLIDGVPEALQALRCMGKRLIFVTNNSTKSRRQYMNKFGHFGLDVNEDEIFSSSFAAAMFLKLNGFPREKKVYVIGEEGILEELELAGYIGLGGPVRDKAPHDFSTLKLPDMYILKLTKFIREDGKKSAQMKSNSLFEHDKNVGAVIVGLDQYINYYKLQYANLCIRENPGCLFIATNRDAVGHLTDLQEWPGAGCMVAAVCGTVQKDPIVVGKPSTFMMDFLVERYQVDTSKMCMVGDRLDTDILFGKSAGCQTLLVLSGVTTVAELEDTSNKIIPDYYTSSVSDIISLSKK